MGYPLSDSERLEEAKTNIVNILKMENYKLDSGELFQAFKEAGGEMSDFSPALEELAEENQIKTDGEGNIMTVQDYDRKKSQLNEEQNEPKEKTTEEVTSHSIIQILRLLLYGDDYPIKLFYKHIENYQF